MKKSKKIVISIISITAVAAITVGSFFIWKNNDNKYKGDEKIFVSPVEEVNTALSFSLSGQCYSGVVESQKTYDVKYDTSKKIKEVYVKEGDSVEEGTELFIYDVKSMELEKEQAELEIERMNNEISSMQKQISELESEKKKASQDEQFSYTTQIQSLETDVARVQYDIKVKNAEIDKLKNSIENAVVKSEMTGTVQKVKNLSDNDENAETPYSYYDEGNQQDADVVVTIIENGNFRIKGKVNEQNVMFISESMPVIIRSRAEESVIWSGIVSEVSSEPANNSDSMNYHGGSDEMSSSSSYNFYITPDNTDGLMLGQHVIIEPDTGQSEEIEKSGIWLYEDYIVTDSDGKKFVWATDKKDRLEKRYVEIGQQDETFGDYEIISGLKDSDSIAYPSDDYEEGMYTTTDINEENFDDGSGDVIIDEDFINEEGVFEDGMYEDGAIIEGDIDGNDVEIQGGEDAIVMPEVAE